MLTLILTPLCSIQGENKRAQANVEVLSIGDLASPRVGDIVETMKRLGRRHALSVDFDRSDKQSIHGIISTTHISKQLGETINTADRVGNIAQLASSK